MKLIFFVIQLWRQNKQANSDIITSLFEMQQLFLWYLCMKMLQLQREWLLWDTEWSPCFPHPAARKYNTARAN